MSISIVERATLSLEIYLRLVLTTSQGGIAISVNDLKLDQPTPQNKEGSHQGEGDDQKPSGLPDGTPSGAGGMSGPLCQRPCNVAGIGPPFPLPDREGIDRGG